jgi:2-C-methyl-D-erythritol 2,4-cyclodiphosphate synthase
MQKIGIGYDIHKLVGGRKLIIGGTEVICEYGAMAHSDGDVLIHSLVDSLVSGLGVGDIGTLFPDTDDTLKGISSVEILKRVKEQFLADVEILNIDSVVVLDKPKIYPYIPRMRAKLAEVLGISEHLIGIKGKTSEGTRLSTIECTVVTLIDDRTKRPSGSSSAPSAAASKPSAPSKKSSSSSSGSKSKKSAKPVKTKKSKTEKKKKWRIF